VVKTNRLLEITLILLNKSSVTAGEPADRFDVSTRTIYRDVDELSAAGELRQAAGAGNSPVP